MTVRRTLTTATSTAALTALIAFPAAAADGATLVTQPGDSTVVLDETDMVEPPHADIEGMIITEGRIIGANDGYKTRIVRSDTWQPGLRKAEGDSYVGLRPEVPGRDGHAVEIVRSDTWQPGYRKAEGGDYVRLVPTDQEGRDGVDIAIIVEPTGRDAAQVLTFSTDAVPSNMYREHSDTWQPGYLKADQDGYYRDVVIRRALPASELPDF